MQNANASLFLFTFGDMKKVFIILIVTLISLPTLGQISDILDAIEAKGSGVVSFESHVTRHNEKADVTTSIEEGILYYVRPDKIASYFDNGDYMVVNGNHMKIDIGIFHGRFKLSRNKLMRSISRIYLYAAQGLCRKFAEEGNYDMKINKEQDYFIVQCTSQKKHLLGLGYQQISFYYGQNDLLIKKIVLIDNNNIIETFTLSDIHCDISIDESKFEL